jgi:hypothetical protein
MVSDSGYGMQGMMKNKEQKMRKTAIFDRRNRIF